MKIVQPNKTEKGVEEQPDKDKDGKGVEEPDKAESNKEKDKGN